MIGKLVTKKFGGEMYWQTSLNGEKNMKMFVPHMNAHQRVTSAKEDFINPVVRITRCVNTSQPLSPSSLSLSNGIIKKVARVAGIEVMHVLNNVDFHSPGLTWLQPLLSVQSASSRDQHQVLGHIFPG